MEAQEVIITLNKAKISQLLKVVVKKVKKENAATLDADFLQIENLEEEQQIEFGRLLLAIIASQDNEFGKFVSNRVKKMAVASNDRASEVAVDIIVVSAVLIPLIQSKVRIKWSKRRGLELDLNAGGDNLLKILRELVSPIKILASKVKKMSLGNIEIEGEGDEEEK